MRAFLCSLVTACCILLAMPATAQKQPAVAKVFSSPVNAGCYIAGPDDCRIHVDPFTINIQAGSKLVLFELLANGTAIYSFRTDVSNPPASNYTPSLVALDFAATCGVVYTVNLLGRDSLDANTLNMGQTAQFTCPSSVP